MNTEMWNGRNMCDEWRDKRAAQIAAGARHHEALLAEAEALGVSPDDVMMHNRGEFVPSIGWRKVEAKPGRDGGTFGYNPHWKPFTHESPVHEGNVVKATVTSHWL